MNYVVRICGREIIMDEETFKRFSKAVDDAEKEFKNK